MEETNCILGVKFPPEIYEHIFSFLDGYTLMQIEKVCNEWKEIVQWLGKNTLIWKRACNSDIPRKVFLTMLPKIDSELNTEHETLYRNWISWQHVSNYKSIQISSENSFSCKLNNITCAKNSGNHIIYGTIQGVVGVLLDQFELKEIYEPSSKVMVHDIFFMNQIKTQVENDYYHHSHLLVIYDYELKLFSLSPKLTEVATMAMPRLKISVCDNFICLSDTNGYIEIFKVNFNATVSADFLIHVTSFRLYRPMSIETIDVFDKIVTVVTKNKIFKLDFNKDAPKWRVGMGQLLPFPYESIDRFWTFYHEVVFANGYTDLHVTTITHGKEMPVISHTFNWMQCLGGPICEIYYYGNILFITTHVGQVYIYVINDWSTFNLMKYDFRINLQATPILTLDFQELLSEHRLIAATQDCIYQIFLYKEF